MIGIHGEKYILWFYKAKELECRINVLGNLLMLNHKIQYDSVKQSNIETITI